MQKHMLPLNFHQKKFSLALIAVSLSFLPLMAMNGRKKYAFAKPADKLQDYYIEKKEKDTLKPYGIKKKQDHAIVEYDSLENRTMIEYVPLYEFFNIWKTIDLFTCTDQYLIEKRKEQKKLNLESKQVLSRGILATIAAHKRYKTSNETIAWTYKQQTKKILSFAHALLNTTSTAGITANIYITHRTRNFDLSHKVYKRMNLSVAKKEAERILDFKKIVSKLETCLSTISMLRSSEDYITIISHFLRPLNNEKAPSGKVNIPGLMAYLAQEPLPKIRRTDPEIILSKMAHIIRGKDITRVATGHFNYSDHYKIHLRSSRNIYIALKQEESYRDHSSSIIIAYIRAILHQLTIIHQLWPNELKQELNALPYYQKILLAGIGQTLVTTDRLNFQEKKDLMEEVTSSINPFVQNPDKHSFIQHIMHHINTDTSTTTTHILNALGIETYYQIKEKLDQYLASPITDDLLLIVNGVSFTFKKELTAKSIPYLTACPYATHLSKKLSYYHSIPTQKMVLKMISKKTIEEEKVPYNKLICILNDKQNGLLTDAYTMKQMESWVQDITKDINKVTFKDVLDAQGDEIIHSSDFQYFIDTSFNKDFVNKLVSQFLEKEQLQPSWHFEFKKIEHKAEVENIITKFIEYLKKEQIKTANTFMLST